MRYKLDTKNINIYSSSINMTCKRLGQKNSLSLLSHSTLLLLDAVGVCSHFKYIRFQSWFTTCFKNMFIQEQNLCLSDGNMKFMRFASVGFWDALPSKYNYQLMFPVIVHLDIYLIKNNKNKYFQEMYCVNWLGVLC